MASISLLPREIIPYRSGTPPQGNLAIPIVVTQTAYFAWHGHPMADLLHPGAPMGLCTSGKLSQVKTSPRIAVISDSCAAWHGHQMVDTSPLGATMAIVQHRFGRRLPAPIPILTGVSIGFLL